MSYKLTRLKEEDVKKFKRLAQEAFQKSYEDEFGTYEKTILPEEDIDKSLYVEGAVAYAVMENGEMLAGAIVNIDPETGRNHLDILFVKVGIQSKGIGMYIWNEIERLYPDTKVWETFTPYYEKRNIHFYVNKCGFRIAEFFHPQHLAEWDKDDDRRGNMPDKAGRYFLRFEKIMR